MWGFRKLATRTNQPRPTSSETPFFGQVLSESLLRSRQAYRVADDFDGTNLASTHHRLDFSTCATPVIVVTDQQLHGVEPMHLRVSRFVVLEVPASYTSISHRGPGNPTPGTRTVA
jgi:hypothetical protein